MRLMGRRGWDGIPCRCCNSRFTNGIMRTREKRAWRADLRND